MSRGRRGGLAAAAFVLIAACRQTAEAPQQTGAPETQQAGSPQTQQGAQPPAPVPAAAARDAAAHVTGHGTDAGNASICEDFRLTDAQAQEFFAKAQTITATQLHDDYDVLPCWVEGETSSGGDTAKWKIRAGGTAEVTARNGDVSYLGCKTCDDILQ